MENKRPNRNSPPRRNKDNYKTQKKDEFNQIFAEASRKVYQEHKGNVIYLDHEQGATTKALHDKGIPLKRLYAPNSDYEVVNKLEKLGINTEHTGFEQYVAESERKYISAYYDGCGSPFGNTGGPKNTPYWGVFPMSALQKLLGRMNRNFSTVLAFTACLRPGLGRPYSNDEVEEIFMNQIENVILNCGFAYEEIHVEHYMNGGGKTHMMFCCWKLTPHNIQMNLDYEQDWLTKQPLGFRPILPQPKTSRKKPSRKRKKNN